MAIAHGYHMAKLPYITPYGYHMAKLPYITPYGYHMAKLLYTAPYAYTITLSLPYTTPFLSPAYM
jgi:hypothetical protein